MKRNVPNEPNMEAILDLLTSLDGGLLEAIPEQDVSIVITITPAAADEDDETDCGDEEDYDDEDCCPDYEPADGEDGRCVYCCPECGTCLRDYIGEEFE